MAIHTELPIHASAYDLVKVVTRAVVGMRRDAKPVLGQRLFKDCVRVTDLIRAANIANSKVPHLEKLLARISRIEVALRVAVELDYIKRPAYGEAIRLTQSVAKQAMGWRSSSGASPVARPSRQPGPSDPQPGRAAGPQGHRHAR